VMRRSQRTRSSIGLRGYPAPRLWPVHILVLTDRDWTHPQGGGTGTNLYGQVSRWLSWGHRVSVIAAGYDGGAPFERHGDLMMYRVGGRSTVFPRAIFKQWRGLATRYEKRAVNYRAMLVLASIVLWLEP